MRAEQNDDVRGSDEERESEYDSLYKGDTHTHDRHTLLLT